ncbi:hypothetical protein [uncultured Fluviicola sp.]|uniref:hypothetical protein n=1 Tax=uncultured Fluviicola sp. TaxID=463303 RepID=UPI0025E6A0E7|nr:hypothetical protein [uncultured Fluviicola sp.]
MNRTTQSQGIRNRAWFLLAIFTWSTLQPTFSYAGGPTQPEAAAFTPVGVSDMVDPFTGDFTYNIPLMDIEGYPINIAYNSGVTMDQDASWVGLGWNLNAGAITRALRGLPDDFNGDQVTKKLNTKPNFNINIDAGLGLEIVGFSIPEGGGGGLNLSVGMGFNNYSGYSSNVSIGPSFDFGKFLGGNLTAGFSLSGSSENGASFSPNVSLSYKEKVSEAQDTKRTGTIGTAFNSRAGLQQISFGFSVSKLYYKTKTWTAGGATSTWRERNQFGKEIGDGGSTASTGGAFDFGVAQYLPTPQHSKFGASASFRMNVSGSVFGVDGQGNIGVSLSRSWIPAANQTINQPSYGYLFSQNGLSSSGNQLDFNRDNDQSFSKYSVNLPSAFQTYDLFNVMAQGTGGSFRPIRNDVGYVYDPFSSAYDIGANVGVELGFGNLTDIGVDIDIPITNTTNGPWSDNNSAYSSLRFRSGGAGNIVPSFSFIEASESSVTQDDMMNTQFYGPNPERLVLAGSAMSPRINNSLNQGGSIKTISKNKKSLRDYANNQLYFLSRGEVQANLGVIPFVSGNLFSGAPAHHIGEITQLGQDGRRYVFAMPVYNHFQEDVTFACGAGLYGSGGINYAENQSGVITGISTASESSGDASPGNDRGIDHYYSSTKMPAYAHSYMLSAVLSDDYVDSDGTPGPSKDDLGSYVAFDYETVTSHEWRTPIQAGTAYHNEGMRSDKSDDKASFVHGKKDLKYLNIVRTKNYVAVFQTAPRKDGRSAAGRNGGLNTADGQSTRFLKSITLYTKSEYDAHFSDLTQATPVQKVEFEYDYSLCKNYPGNDLSSSTDPSAPTNEGGKLTLKKIKFSYQNSQKMKYRDYEFDYGSGSTENPDYHLKGSDRWGTYKKPVTGTETDITTPLNNSDYPYTDQNKTTADANAGAWSLRKIHLPSGGQIEVTYEADDYAYVQHKKAAQMFKIAGIYLGPGNTPGLSVTNAPSFQSLDNNPEILVELDSPTDRITNHCKAGQQLYFRVLSELNPTGDDFKKKTEFVSGYGIIQNLPDPTNPVIGADGRAYGRIKLRGEKLKDSDNDPPNSPYSPMIAQAILFGRTQLSRTINNNFEPSSESGESEQAVISFVNATINMLTSFKELVTGPNKAIYDQGKGRRIVINKSWVRLDCASGHKYGGGSRVAKIEIKDNWSDMEGGTSSTYGQVYEYVLEDGTSSGVASYEPQLGGDENPWHTAYMVNNKRRLAMDDKMYIDDPIMESQFPSPSVGYSRVVIKDLPHEGVKRTATGKVVKEFYTAKDFPTIVKRTDVDMLTDHSLLPIGPKYQYLTANQGFSIELNNMHGKTKKESVYGEDQTSPLSTVEYYYKCQDLNLDGVPNKRLKNEISVIDEKGVNSTATIGVRYDLVGDFRESETKSRVPKIHINTNSFIIGIIPILVPPVYPGYDQTTNRFRSATMNKTINRFAVLEKVVANQDGSIVETNNLAFDKNTGEVLVTQTTTNFNDKVYSLNYPAYWKYPAFGQASKNIMYSYKAPTVTNNGFAAIPSQYNYFTEGDEVSVAIGSATPVKGWVVDVNASGIKIMKKDGSVFSGNNVTIKVIRSGYKNKQTTSMASMTALSNPIAGIATNQFTNVLNAGAVEFGQDWRTYCDCFKGPINPNAVGTKGNWRPIRSYTYLTGRTQANYDGNTNIRKDGVFTAYAPFYKLGNGVWEKNNQNWTFVSEVTEFSPNGMALETRDALGRYSATLYSYNNTLTSAVAANAKGIQIASGGFEDLSYTNCMDQGFFSKAKIGNSALGSIPSGSLSTTQSHTGKTSIKVLQGNPVRFENVLSTCTTTQTCNLSLNCSGESNCSTVNISGGTAPYTLDYEVVGTASADMTSGTQITTSINTGSSVNSLIIIVTDSKGCKAAKKYKVSDGGVTTENITQL